MYTYFTNNSTNTGSSMNLQTINMAWRLSICQYKQKKFSMNLYLNKMVRNYGIKLSTTPGGPTLKYLQSVF